MNKKFQLKRRNTRKPFTRQDVVVLSPQHESNTQAYDVHLFERARTQWQFGDWSSLAQLDLDNIKSHPDRANLALLAAAGKLQTGQQTEGSELLSSALEWGISKRKIAEILISGVHNSIGKVLYITQNENRAFQHFRESIYVGAAGLDVGLLTKVRINEQIQQIGIPKHQHQNILATEAGRLFHDLANYKFERTLKLPETIFSAWVSGNWSRLIAIDNSELAERPSRSLLALYAAAGYQQTDDVNGLNRCLKFAREWGCTSEQIKRMLRAGIRNTLAIADVLTGNYTSAAINFTAALAADGKNPNLENIEQRIRQQVKNIKNINTEVAIGSILENIQVMGSKHE